MRRPNYRGRMEAIKMNSSSSSRSSIINTSDSSDSGNSISICTSIAEVVVAVVHYQYDHIYY